MNDKANRNYNSPEGITIVPQVLIMIAHYWAKGKTIAEAWKNLQGYSGLTLRQMKRDSHIIYTVFDYTADDESEKEEKEVCTYINEMGSICYHQDYPPITIVEHKRK